MVMIIMKSRIYKRLVSKKGIFFLSKKHTSDVPMTSLSSPPCPVRSIRPMVDRMAEHSCADSMSAMPPCLCIIEDRLPLLRGSGGSGFDMVGF